MNMSIPLTVCIIDSADGTGDGEGTDGGSDCGDTVYRRHSTGPESFR